MEQNIGMAVTLLKAMSNESRLRIICAIYQTEKSVRELEAIVGLSQSALSQHLARMREEGLVTARRDAQNVYYALNDQKVTDILHTLYELYRPGISTG